MFGKSLCNYLQARLPLAGIHLPFFCNEDWGWWLQTEYNGIRMGLCIYSDPDADPDPERYTLMPSIHDPRQWLWPSFLQSDRLQLVTTIIDALEKIFSSAADLHAVIRHNDHPL